MKALLILICLLIINFSFDNKLKAQVSADKIFTTLIAHNDLIETPIKRKNIFLRFYKNYLSEQFNADCQFSNSCSVYMIESIKAYGIFKGFFAGADRLTRCGSQDYWYSEFPVFVCPDGAHLREDVESIK